MEFNERNILVVGASSGMGRTISLRLARLGARVAVTARRAALLHELVQTIKQENQVALALPADGTDEEAAANVVSEVIKHFGGIDMVLLNAGGAPAIYMPKMNASEVKFYMKSNYDTVVNYLFPVLEHMKQRRGGLVVHTNSLGSFYGVPLQGPYCAAKAAGRLLIDTCRIEFEEFGIRFVSLYPGFIATEATKGDGMPAPGEISEEAAVDYMVDAIRREEWDFMFPPHAAANTQRAMQLSKPELNQYLRKRILEGAPT